MIAQRVAAGLGHTGPVEPVPTQTPAKNNLKPSLALGIRMKAKPTLEGCKIGCLIGDNTDAYLIASLKARGKKKAGAVLAIVSLTIEGPMTSDGKSVEPDFRLAGGQGTRPGWGAPRCAPYCKELVGVAPHTRVGISLATQQ